MLDCARTLTDAPCPRNETPEDTEHGKLKPSRPRRFTPFTLSLMTLALSACIRSNKGETDEDTPGSISTLLSGTALKGPLLNAFAFADLNGDGIWNSGSEVRVKTDADGKFSIIIPQSEPVPIIITTTDETVDSSTGLAVPNVTLRAPAGSAVISPLTTLVVDTGLTKEQIAEAFNLVGIDILTFNPFDTTALNYDADAALAVEKTAHQVMTTIRAVAATIEKAGVTDPAEAFKIAAEAISTTIKSSVDSGTASVDLTDSSFVTQVFVDAVEKAAAVVTDDAALRAELGNAKSAVVNAITNVNTTIGTAENLEDADTFGTGSQLTEILGEADGDGGSGLSDFLFKTTVAEGTVSFTGAASGAITVTIEGDTASFTSGGISVAVVNISSTKVTLTADQTLALTLDEYQILGGNSGAGKLMITVAEGRVIELAAEKTLHVLPDDLDGASAAQTYLNSNAVASGDTVYVRPGTHDFDLTINKPIKLLGANFGEAIHSLGDDQNYSSFNEFFDSIATSMETGMSEEATTAYIRDELVAFDVMEKPRSYAETWNQGTMTIASNGVTIDGFRLHSAEGGLSFEASKDINDFSFLNSYLTGHNAGAVAFNDLDGGSKGWLFGGNLIGGVSTAEGNGGSLYLTGLSDSQFEDNVFWRPGAAHLYLSDVTGLTFSNNFFYHGLHAGGANFDGLLEGGGTGYGYGYGNEEGDGYGYGYGYGSDGGTDTGGGEPYYGRNYWAEVKGITSNLVFSDNLGLLNSGGIQFWDEGNAENFFTDITIADNIFAGFINADPGGFLDSLAGTSRHVSGITGGITWETLDNSTSSGLNITDNVIVGDVENLINDGDIAALIYILGATGETNIADNILRWDTEGDISDAKDSRGILILRELLEENDIILPSTITVSGNSFSHGNETAGADYASYALLLGISPFGVHEAQGSDNAEEPQTSNTLVILEGNIFEGYELPKLTETGLEYDEETFLFALDVTSDTARPRGVVLEGLSENNEFLTSSTATFVY